MNQATAEYETLSDEEKARLRKADREKLEAIPAYKEGFRYGLKVHGALKPYMEAVPEGQEPDEDLFIAFRDCLIIAVKIAGGHGVGYEDDALCGNIVRCKRSLQAANQCLVALHSLRDRGFASSDHIDPLITEGQEVRDLVAKHIADLRSRVWWE
jgi:hypothetical protein